jgi:hypothetical protein
MTPAQMLRLLAVPASGAILAFGALWLGRRAH